MAFTIEFTAKSPDASIVSAPSATVKYSFDVDADLKTDVEKLAQQTDGMSGDVLKLGKSGFPAASKEFNMTNLAEKKLTVLLTRQMAENNGLDTLITEAKAAVANPAPEQGAFTGFIGKLQSVANSPMVAGISDAISILAGGASAAKKLA